VFCDRLSSQNGSFTLRAVLVLNQSQASGVPLWAQVNVSGANGSVSYSIDFGDSSSGSFYNVSSSATIAFAHTYASPSPGQQVNWSVYASTSTRQAAFLSAVLPLGGNATGNSSGSSSGTFPCAGATCLYLRSSLGPIQYGIDFRLNNSSSAPYPVVINGSFTGGVAPETMDMRFGDGSASVTNFSSSPANFRITHFYAYASGFLWSDSFRDANRTTVNVSLFLVVGRGSPNGSGGNNSSGAYPTPVSVVVAADPVTGGRPLNVTFSAYIDGGSPPFTVRWSLPNGTGSGATNATGLMASAVYSVAGWFPATAFVYNTTNPYGTVLVGYGSVWVYVTGGGGGSGNNSSNESIHPGTIDSSPGAPGNLMGFLDGTTFVALLLALALGGVVGAILGFAFGRGGRPPRAAAVPPPG
jgi:hypothetical protein